ncbi:MAG TPA: diacylglycerol kinase family protein [Terriglobales bacterium]
MRVAVILGLGASEKELVLFRKNSSATFTLGVPADPADADAILILGGDGTVHRHLAQLVRLNLPVLVVPRGSGNDFARALELRSTKDSVNAWHGFCLSRANVKSIDLGLISPIGTDGSTPSYFATVAGVGLDADVARRANKLPRWLRGHGGYALSLPPALFGFIPTRMRISAIENDALVPGFNQPVFMTAFANTAAYGGGMKIAPHAQMDDGKLDVCVISEIEKLKLFCLFPTVYFGRHLDVPQVEYFQAERIRVETDTPMEVYADGEFVCRTPADVGVKRNALQVIVPNR